MSVCKIQARSNSWSQTAVVKGLTAADSAGVQAEGTGVAEIRVTVSKRNHQPHSSGSAGDSSHSGKIPCVHHTGASMQRAMP